VSPALSVLILLGAEAIALKEKAVVHGRWVRIIDLLDADRSDPATRARIAELYIGRAPEEGQTRVISAAEIRRELEGRGIDLSAVIWNGDSVEVSRGVSADAEAFRKTVTKALQRHVGAATVKLVTLQPETCPGDVVEIRSNGTGFTAVMSGGEKVDVVARILRIREAVFAARDLQPGRKIERTDVEIRRIEMSDDDRTLDLDAVVGSIVAVRLRLGAAITPAELRLKPAIRKGDIVRAVSTGYEVDARALEDGATGQEISLEFSSSKNRVRARVVSAARVDVVEASR